MAQPLDNENHLVRRIFLIKAFSRSESGLMSIYRQRCGDRIQIIIILWVIAGLLGIEGKVAIRGGLDLV
jgi:hypothetical protein